MKIVLTVLVLAYTALFIDETIRVARVAKMEIDALGAVPF